MVLRKENPNNVSTDIIICVFTAYQNHHQQQKVKRMELIII